MVPAGRPPIDLDVNSLSTVAVLPAPRESASGLRYWLGAKRCETLIQRFRVADIIDGEQRQASRLSA